MGDGNARTDRLTPTKGLASEAAEVISEDLRMIDATINMTNAEKVSAAGTEGPRHAHD